MSVFTCRLYDVAKKAGYNVSQVDKLVLSRYGKQSVGKLTNDEYISLYHALRAKAIIRSEVI